MLMDAKSNEATKVALFCGSSPDCPVEYKEAAEQLAIAIAKNWLGLVYGGGNWGLMGICAKKASELSVEVIGVLPRFMQAKAGISHGELKLVEGMAERKSVINELANYFVALPGGFGTLDEVTEMITWNQLGHQCKPIGLLNVNGYWDFLVQWAERGIKDGFINPIHWSTVIIDDNPMRLIQRLIAFTPNPNMGKFIIRA